MSNAQDREWNNTGMKIPAHVPDDAVRDFDFYFVEERGSSGAFDVYEAYKRLHDGPDIFYSPRNEGHWVVTRYDDMEAIYSDEEHFNNRINTIPAAPHGGFGFLNYDGPRHAAFRNLLQPFFSRQAVAKFEST